MSNHTIEFSTDAEDDLRSILEYSLATWGPRQHDQTRVEIQARIRQLASFPSLGPARDEIGAGVRALAAGSYVLIYVFDGQRIVILRIVHERRDVTSGLARRSDRIRQRTRVQAIL